MKFKLYTFLFVAGFTVLFNSCTKQEVLKPDPAKVIQLLISGTTTDELEFIYKDSVIAVASNPTGFEIKTLISVNNKNDELKIRKKGSTEILQSRIITQTPFSQNMNVYYDGNTVYNDAVSYHIKGYALTGELEFLLDENLVLTGTDAIEGIISIGIEKGKTRQIQVRQKGETTPLITKTITSSPTAQSLTFLYDGSSIVDNIQLNPPSKPENMAISAKFQSTLPDLFKGVDVDILFYVKNINTGEAVLTSPEIRLTLQANGAFSPTIELPPLPNTTDYIYNFDIFEKGTNTLPYNTSSISPSYPVKPNLAARGQGFSFQAGSTKLYVIKDYMSTIKLPLPKRATYFYGDITDLSVYFQ